MYKFKIKNLCYLDLFSCEQKYGANQLQPNLVLLRIQLSVTINQNK